MGIQLMTPFILLFLFSISGTRSEPCVLDLDSESSWPEHPPILTDYDGALILPDGERGNRSLNIRENQVFLLGCPLTEFVFLEDVQAIFGQCRGGNWAQMESHARDLASGNPSMEGTGPSSLVLLEDPI